MQPSWSHRVHSDRLRAIALPSAPAAQANHRGMVASLTYDSHPTVVRRHGTSQSASEPTEPIRFVKEYGPVNVEMAAKPQVGFL
jgi:hypothetical protein